MGTARAAAWSVALIVPALAGCLAPGVEPPAGLAATVGGLRVVTGTGAPIPYAQLAAVGDAGLLLIASADGHGVVTDLALPAAARTLEVGAVGYGTLSFAVSALPREITLAPGTDADPSSLLRFLPPVELRCAPLDPPPYSCRSFGEPVVEVAGDGAIWASATCCIGKAPPIWVSRDGGKSFALLPAGGTALVREGFGIEGDFGIDDAGNVYFFDISAASTWFTSYTAAGDHRWTLPMAFPPSTDPPSPLVDRPWVRGGRADEVFIFYNTGESTRFYASRDGGVTWDLQGGHEFPCAVGVPGQGPARNDLLLASACIRVDADNTVRAEPKVWTSHDGGATWGPGEAVPLPAGDYKAREGRYVDQFVVPVVDEAGWAHVFFTHRPDPASNETLVYDARRSPDGEWSGPFPVSPPGQNEKPWPAGGRAGVVGVAWYHSDSAKPDNETQEFRLMTAASVDADAPTPHFQVAVPDPDVLTTGAFGRSLGDFLESDFGPDGRFVAVYGKRTQSTLPSATRDDDLVIRFVASDGGLALGPLAFLNGPRPAP